VKSHLVNELSSYLQDDSGDIDMQYSASIPVRMEFHFSALCHGDNVLWAGCGLWLCVGVPYCEYQKMGLIKNGT